MNEDKIQECLERTARLEERMNTMKAELTATLNEFNEKAERRSKVNAMWTVSVALLIASIAVGIILHFG